MSQGPKGIWSPSCREMEVLFHIFLFLYRIKSIYFKHLCIWRRECQMGVYGSDGYLEYIEVLKT